MSDARVFAPADTGSLLAWLRAGYAAKRPFWIAGQGDPHPDPAALQLDLSAFNQTLFFDPDDMVVGVGVGKKHLALQKELAAEGMGLPVNPWFDDDTVGSLVAKNRFGPERLYRGGVRDWVIGMTYATVDGRLIEVGGRVVKNVTGYDLARFMVGNRGELAVLLSVNFKLMPLPHQPEALLFRGPAEAWPRAVAALIKAHIPLDWAQVRLAAGTVRLGVGISGGTARRRSLKVSLEETTGAAWSAPEQSPDESLFHRLADGPALAGLTGAAPVHAYGRLATSVLLQQENYRQDCQVIHPIGADIHRFVANPSVLSANEPEAGVSWVLEQAPPDCAIRRLPAKTPEAVLHQKLKASFDPCGCLPSHFHGG
ncbi:FAD-binding oxidoreductase [Acanthopleuribacter pedis]|uniref:FAD-binding oxidoreductase n=1 Tax=Acanthopleuribacter pedis TaxID=442870 RepID=A0A8J7Q2Z0_9BACT|nr:FAD-binding oxidoreductase [Acanthopleuribacter pedis]MBO1319567.1 FAD-binding oxidoreductase [Acanthopleuribacter pedis]